MKHTFGFGHWILDGQGNPVQEHDVIKWAEWFEKAQKSKLRVVAQTDIGHYQVSTVFLATNHSIGGSTPLLFETMVFDKRAEPGRGVDKDDWFGRYPTRQDAIVGHQAIVGLVRKETGIQ